LSWIHKGSAIWHGTIPWDKSIIERVESIKQGGDKTAGVNVMVLEVSLNNHVASTSIICYRHQHPDVTPL
jgi:hypothetical protein